jgi:hypothetical protein
MEKYDSPKGLDNDGRNHYETLGKGLSDHFKSGVDYVKNSRFASYVKRADKNIDKLGENICHMYTFATSNDPASESWTGRHRGTLLKMAVIGGVIAADIGISEAVGNYLGYKGDNTVIKVEKEGGSSITTGSPFLLKMHTEKATGVPPYVTKDDLLFPGNAGKNADYFKGKVREYLTFIELGGVAVVEGVHEFFKSRKKKSTV